MTDEWIEAILWLSQQDCAEAFTVREAIRRLQEENGQMREVLRSELKEKGDLRDEIRKVLDRPSGQVREEL